MDSQKPAINESALIAIIGLIQFINILDFMMVMPLGPDFALALGIPAENIAVIGGTYTLAAAVTGLIASLFLDRFDRKRALLVSLIGLAVATACGALANSLGGLIAARAVAGMFGGPLTSLAIAMIADHIPPERRGAAMGKVMGAFAAASVLGVPFGLELASRIGWRAPFLALGCIAGVVFLFALRFLPACSNLRQTGTFKTQLLVVLRCFKNPVMLAAFGFMSFSMMAGFMIIPNISAHLQMNMDYPRGQLGLLYFCGGAVSFFSMRAVGKLIDKTGSTRVGTWATLLLIATLAAGFVWYHNPVPVLLIFVLFMVAMTSRNVAAHTLSSKVPEASERASFMSLQSSIVHLSSSLGAFASAQMLTHTEEGRLEGIEQVGMAAILLSCFVPLLFYRAERGIRRRTQPLPLPVPELL